MNFSQAAENNKHVIAELLVPAFADAEHVLEIGSGTGQHAVHFASLLHELNWQPSDLAENLPGLEARFAAEASPNVRVPVELDVMAGDWSIDPVDAVYSANAIHIMSWPHVEAMIAGVGRVLNPRGKLILYGPFKYGGEFTTPSNAGFDQWLKARDPESGIRDFEQVDTLAQQIGLNCIADHPMPANNQLIIWQQGEAQ